VIHIFSGGNVLYRLPECWRDLYSRLNLRASFIHNRVPSLSESQRLYCPRAHGIDHPRLFTLQTNSPFCHFGEVAAYLSPPDDPLLLPHFCSLFSPCLRIRRPPKGFGFFFFFFFFFFVFEASTPFFSYKHTVTFAFLQPVGSRIFIEQGICSVIFSCF